MAQPKALKSQYGQNPEQLKKSKEAAAGNEDIDFSAFVKPYAPQDEDEIIPPETAFPETPRGLPPERQQQQAERPFQGPLAPEFYQGQTPAERFAPVQGMFPTPGPQYAGAEGGIEPVGTYSPQDIDKLIDAGQLGASLAVGAAFPALGAAGVGTTEAALSLFADTLKNQVNTDAKQISTPSKLFNAALIGVTAGATTKAVQWFLGKVIGNAAKTGDEAILEEAKKAMQEKFGDEAVKESVEAAEKAGVRLTPAEAFPFDKEAQMATVEGLREHPNLGIDFANRIGKYKQAILGLFSDATPMEKSGTVRDFVDETVKSYRTRIGSIQKQLSQAGADMSDIRLDGQKLLSTLDDRMKQINGDLKDDVLNAVAPEMNTIRNELSNALKRAEAGEFIKGEAGGVIVDSFGKPLSKGKAAPAQLTLNDIEKFRDRISDLTESAYSKLANRQQLSRSEEMAKAMYKDVAKLRDEMSEQIANKMGRPELAKEVQSLRKEYSTKIDAWETISDRLSKAPVDELKYLFPKNDPELAGKIVSVLKPEQVSGLRREFVNRLIDPVYLREAGEEAAKNTLSTARKQFSSYDPGVLKAIYSDGEITAIKRFLDLGERAENVLSKTGMPTGKVGIVKQLTALISNPANADILSGFVDNLAPTSPLRKAMDYRLYLSGKRAAGDLSADTVRALGAPEAGLAESIKTGAKQAVTRFQDIIPQAAKKAVPAAAQITGRSAAGSVRNSRQEETE